MIGRGRVAVIGAGAIGSLVAGRLAAAGFDVTMLARGRRLARLNAGPLTIHAPEGEVTVSLAARETLPRAAFDILITAVKAYSLPGLVSSLKAAAGDGARLLPLVNGVPWWLFKDGGAFDARIGVVDPNGDLCRAFAARDITGAVVYARAELDEHGNVVSQGGEKFALGAISPDGSRGAESVAKLMREGGFPVRHSDAIRREVWMKIALNLATNPLSVVSGATLEDMAHDLALRRVLTAILAETLDLAEKLGCRPARNVEQLLADCAGAGPFLTSMAQDFARGAPLELGAIADATFEVAARHGHAMPTARAIVELAAHRARSARDQAA